MPASGLWLRPALPLALAIHAGQFVWVAFGAVLLWAGRGHRSLARDQLQPLGHLGIGRATSRSDDHRGTIVDTDSLGSTKKS